MSQLIPPLRAFKDHVNGVRAAGVSPDGRRMVTGSFDKTLRLWDLKTAVVLKKMEGHHSVVRALAISRDGKMIASSDDNGEVIAWHGETGDSLTQAIKTHAHQTWGVDFSPDGTVLATGSKDQTTKLWNTKSWQMQGDPILCGSGVNCVRYSPSGELLAIATDINIQIYDSGMRKHVANFKAHPGWNWSLAWTPDGTRLLSGGDHNDPNIREWDTSTWEQVGDPWTGHTSTIYTIVFHPASTHVASASDDSCVRIWRLSDRQTIAIFRHTLGWAACVAFSVDGKHILSGGLDKMISEWQVPKEVDSKILAINTAARNACVSGDLSAAEQLFTQDIDADANNYTSHANRSLVMARKHDWDNAIEDAIKSITIQPSLAGHISKGIALCGKGQLWDAMAEFDLAFIFTDEDPRTICFLLLVKAIAIFNAGRHEEGILRVRKLATTCPYDNILACHIVEAYLCVQLGLNAADHNDAAHHFTSAVNASTFSSKLDIHSIYDDLVVLFGWNLKSLWQNAHQKRCNALRWAGRHEEAMDSYRHMMDISDETTKANCIDWSHAFTQEYRAPYIADGDAALAASDYDRAIKLYSAVIGLNSATDTVFANRSKARSAKKLWEDAILDAQKVIKLTPSSHIGYELKYAALHGAQHYDEAIEAFQMMLANLDSASNAQIRKLRDQYVSPSEARHVIRKVIDGQLNNAPLRLLNAVTGLLCDREAQISAFTESTEYKELLLSTMKHPILEPERIAETVATYFRCVMLSHRWEGTEPLLHDIKDKVVYELKAAGGLMKLQSFCDIVRRKTEYHWAWVDSCCIDQHNNVELQKSLNSMFAWYHNSALTIVYLSDVPPLAKPGALAQSSWNTRGWTVPEFLAPKVIRFYQQDWSLYLNDESPNHKETFEIMHELEDATGIDSRALIAFQPGMKDAREKLQWASRRVTTVPEDIAYSLFGIFGVQLPILYGENKHGALGRLLQEIVAQSGDITALDWVGQRSEFNSCLPANISSYAALPCTLPSLSERQIQTAVSSLRTTVAMELASKLYNQLDNMSSPRFANCRLHLPCVAFRVTSVRPNDGAPQETHFTYEVKADGLHDLLITTKETLNQFTPSRSPLQTLLLIRPWDYRLLELPDVGDDTESEDDFRSVLESPLDEFPGGSPVEQEPPDSESHLRALRLVVRLGQPFGAFLLVRQRTGEYKRIASDHDIIAQVKDIASVHSVMDIRTVEIS